MKYRNLGDMFLAKRNEFPDKVAYMYKKAGSWQSVNYTQVVERGKKVAAGLASLGLKKGDRLAVVSANRLEWALADYAAQCLGIVLVPIYPSLLKEQVQYILNDSETKVVLAENDIQCDKINAVKAKLKHTSHFYIIDTEVSKPHDFWKGLPDLEKAGEDYLKENPDHIEKENQTVKEDDWATIIYTSGTTGEPKGAVLTHKNLLSNVESALQVVEVSEKDVFLSFLPLSHVFERMAGHFLAFYCNSTIAYAESIDTVAENMGEIKPTVMTAVPRLYEKMYARVLENVEQGSPVKQKIFRWAVGVGQKYVEKQSKNQKIGAALQAKRNLAYKLVFKKLSERVGGRLRFFISGGAPLSPEIAQFFGAAGLIILEGYGLTETSPVLAVNRLEKFKFGTVGPIVPGVEVKIAEDGEICAKGSNIMVGYFKKEADTKEVIDEKGWFHTGDIGFIDEDGMLKITDRKKNIIVTSGGKNIAPQAIENIMITSKYIEQCLVVGDQRKYCTALIAVSEESFGKWAEAKGLKYSNYLELIKLPGVEDMVSAEIDRLSGGLASYETIKKFHLVPKLFSIESGELTPSLKIKRKVVIENYIDEIEKMYKENNS